MLDQVPDLQRAFPLAPAKLRHNLTDHPLLQIDALADLATQLAANQVEIRRARNQNGAGFPLEMVDPTTLANRVKHVGAGESWIMLRGFEHVPAYRAMLDSILREISHTVGDNSIIADSVRGFIFLSPADALTPMHFDPEYNILFQISGPKYFATYPQGDPWLSPEKLESYHQNGDNLLDWKGSFADDVEVHHLLPGEALYVPYCAPHWVRVGDGPSISLSLTWQNQWSRDAADAMRLNPILHRIGLGASVPQWPRRPLIRALGYRIARRTRLL